MSEEQPPEAYKLYVDNVINHIITLKNGDRMNIAINDLYAIAYISQRIFKSEPMLLEISAPLKICGDIHGQFHDLLRVFQMCGYPPKTRFLFLGDFVDRGTYSLEVLSLLLCLKIKFPKDLFMLRGNHETDMLNRCYGFRAEIRSRFGSSKVWKSFIKTFNYLPCAALVEKSIFCIHGGISPILLNSACKSLKETINEIIRPTDVDMDGLLCDLLWSDPTDLVDSDSRPKGWEENDRGCSWTFGFDIIEEFLDKFDLDLIVRAHQVVEDGYEFYCNRKLLTIFTAPNYCGKFDNSGGIFCLEKNYFTPEGAPPNIEGSFLIIKPEYTPYDQWDKLPKFQKELI